MKNVFRIITLVLVASVLLYGFTKYRGMAITSSTLDSSPVGATTPSTGAFTTLSASSGVNSTAVGNTTPSTGAFTQFQVTTGVTAAAGLKHQRFAGTCTTGTNVGDTCVVTKTWAVAFPDANYTLVCSGGTQHQNTYMSQESKTASNFVIRVTMAGTPTGAGGSYDTVDCIGIHD